MAKTIPYLLLVILIIIAGIPACINNTNRNKQEVLISEDMRDVVLKYLKLDKHYRVQWSAISGTRQAKKTRAGNFEDLWVFTKG